MPIRQTLEVAKHIARSKALITIYGTEGGYNPKDGIPSLSSLKFIGNVTSIDIPVNRGSAERRELNAANFGRIIEIVPGLVDFDGFKLNHVVTYKETFLEACGFRGHVLDYQAYPMLFLFKLPTPDADQFPERTLIAETAWLKNNPLMFSVEEKDDLRITQEVSIAISNLREIT